MMLCLVSWFTSLGFPRTDRGAVSNGPSSVRSFPVGLFGIRQLDALCCKPFHAIARVLLLRCGTRNQPVGRLGSAGGLTALSVVAALAAFVLMEHDFHHTCYRHRTLKTHVREFHWVRNTTWKGHQVACNEERDAVRAEVLRSFARAYWPMDLAREWVREGWAQWLSHPPDWFTEEWRARIPAKEWLSGNADDVVVVSMTKQEASFRRAIGHTPPWDLGARDFEAFLEDRFVNSAALPSAASAKTKRRQLALQISGAGAVGFLNQCCSNDNKAPWVRVSSTAYGEPLRTDQSRVQQLISMLQESGLSFYYQLYSVSASHSPLHGYEFVQSIVMHAHYELMLLRKCTTEHLAILTLTSFEKLESTIMAREKKTLSDVQRACDTSEFVASLYHWSSNGNVAFILGEYAEGGPIVARIKPDIGIETDEEFWRLAFQLAMGLSDIHRTGLTHMDIRVRKGCGKMACMSFPGDS